MTEGLRRRSYLALMAGAQEVSPSLLLDECGYATHWEQNLMEGLPLTAIASDLAAGAGRELDRKLRAAHSSAALAINTFGPWRTDPSSLCFGETTGFRSMCFEAACQTGLGGTSPHLDLLADGEVPVAVESKCTEWMQTKPAVFSVSYDRLRQTLGDSPWFEEMQQLRVEPCRYRFLDAAQLVKHAFGLTTRFGGRPVQLLYLYWEPRNTEIWPECRQHREEADGLASKVKPASVRLIVMSYHELWANWECQRPPCHLPYLRVRYDREVLRGPSRNS